MLRGFSKNSGRIAVCLRRSSSLRRALPAAAVGAKSLTTFSRSNVKICSMKGSTLLFNGSTRQFSTAYPPHQALEMPALSPTMIQGNLAKWLVQEGQKISPGDALCEVETDKATLPWETVDEGYVAKLLIPAGTNEVPVGRVVAIIAEREEDIAAFKDYVPAAKAPSKQQQQQAPPPPPPQQQAPPPPPQQQQQQAPPPQQQAAPSSAGGRVAASPFARTLAKDAGVDLSQVSATGPNRRVVAADVKGFLASGGQAAAAGPTGAFVDIPLSNVRKIIATRLLEAKTTIPHYYLTISCNMDKILKLRSEFNDSSDGQYKLSVNDFVVKAAALALRKVPQVNSSWQNTCIRRYNYVDVCVAVATENGLITPVIHDTDLRGLASISNAVKDLAVRARDNKLKPEEFTGGTFTISNLGMYGIKQFSAIINPPQAAIMAVGSLEKVLVPAKNDKGSDVITEMTVTLSCDHRVVDGAVGAEFLQWFKKFMENPSQMLVH